MTDARRAHRPGWLTRVALPEPAAARVRLVAVGNVKLEPAEEWLDAFVMVRTPPESLPHWFSSFSAVVRDARQATGRDLHTGQIMDAARTGNWLGAMAYLTMLDLVGTCFRPVPLPRASPHRSTIAKALTYFQPALADDDILAIYALRCAFSHDYGLVNVGRSNDPEMQARLHHRFVLVDDDPTPLVKPPAPVDRWDGDVLGPQRRRNVTRVNLRRLGQMAEHTVAVVQQASADRRLKIALAGGIKELYFRFSVMAWNY